MIKVLKKINNAIEIIKDNNLNKKGKNNFSGYNYYTPEQVSELVIGTCHQVGLFPKFDLVRTELGIHGRLIIYDLETEESVEYTMASAIPEIKATNVAQQLGGSMTYTKRYMYMNAFDIVDNSLDFDTSENSAKRKEEFDQTLEEVEESLKLCKTVEDLTNVWNQNPSLHISKEFRNKINKYTKVLTK